MDVPHFLDFAQIVAGCKFYVGNQSFGLSLAEGLKVPRFCEEHHSGPRQSRSERRDHSHHDGQKSEELFWRLIIIEHTVTRHQTPSTACLGFVPGTRKRWV